MTDEIQAEAAMLIRRTVAEVFAAVIDPRITTKFWFTASSGKLDCGKRVRWEWEMYGSACDVDVVEVEENRRIALRWAAPNGDGQTAVEWLFEPRSDETTFVTVRNTGFTGTPDEVARQAIGSTGGFALVLAGMKALLEHDIELGLVRDRFPDRAEAVA
jgi:uncharacterized protein YndB with AHSA1/START domain